MNNFKNVVKATDLSKYNFWHFTTFDTAEKIIKNKYFLLNNVSNMNDIDEANRMHDNKKVFILCFCNSDRENIPMWYLYSGIKGDGVSIGITPKNIIRLKNNLKIYECNVNNEIDFKKEIGKESYSLDCGFVCYEDYNNKILFTGKKYYIKDFDSNNYFTKQYPWHYEHKLRIVIHITKKNFKSNKIGIVIEDDFIKNFRIRYTPEMNKVLKYEFKAKPQKSKMNIRMNLLRKNEKIIKEYLENELLGRKNKIKIQKEEIISIIEELFKSKN